MRDTRQILLALLMLFVISACKSKVDDNSVHEVHWDRDMCERCKMVVSDRHYTVQVVNPKTHKSGMFDDIGCAVLWFGEEQIPWKDQAIIWINDAKSGQWIDARKAYYNGENITPMAYGFAAYKNRADIPAGKEVLDFNQVSQKIIEIEKRLTQKKI